MLNVSIFLTVSVFVLAGAVKGLTGMGLPTVAIALLSLYLPSGLAAILLVVPSLLTNVWQYVRSPGATALLRRISGFLMGILAGALWSPLPGIASAAQITSAITGGVLALYGCACLFGVRLPSSGSREIWVGPLAGVATGVLTVASGVFVVPSVPYLQSLELGKDELIGALGLTFSVCTLCLWFSLGSKALNLHDIVLSTACLAPAMLGLLLGSKLRGKLSEATFRKCFFGSLVILGSYLIARSI